MYPYERHVFGRRTKRKKITWNCEAWHYCSCFAWTSPLLLFPRNGTIIPCLSHPFLQPIWALMWTPKRKNSARAVTGFDTLLKMLTPGTLMKQAKVDSLWPGSADFTGLFGEVEVLQPWLWIWLWTSSWLHNFQVAFLNIHDWIIFVR